MVGGGEGLRAGEAGTVAVYVGWLYLSISTFLQ